MNVVAKSDGTKRARAVSKSKRAPPIYVPLHSTQLSRCLAHGLLFAPGGAVLAPGAGPVAGQVLEEARQGLDYGSVVLVEFEAGRNGFDHAAGDPAAAQNAHWEIPLAWVSRAVFRSAAEKDEFLARASTYEDVPVDALEYAIDPSLFGTGGLLDALGAPGSAAQADIAAGRNGAAIGRISGTIAALLACARWSGGTDSRLDDLHAACAVASTDGSPVSLVRELARAIDFHPSSDNGIVLAGVAAKILSAPGTNSGFDVDTFLPELCRQAEHGGVDAEMLARFETRAGAVLSGAAELREDAFADAQGKVTQRALLLFMLNPEIEALRKIRSRMGNIGQGVFSLACALAGCHGGIARCDAATKAPERAVFLGTTLLAWQIHQRQPMELSMAAGWTPAGAYESSLCVASFRVATATLPAPAQLLSLKSALADMDVDSTFDTSTGALAWRDEKDHGQEFFAYASKSPSFPRVEAVDICIHVDQKALAKGGARSFADACLATRESGVFARQSARGKVKGLELRVACRAGEIRPSIIQAATEVLLAQVRVIQGPVPALDPIA